MKSNTRRKVACDVSKSNKGLYGGVVHDPESGGILFFIAPVMPTLQKTRELLESFMRNRGWDFMYDHPEEFYADLEKPTKEQVTVVVIRSQVTNLWGWMVYNQKNKLLFEEMDSRNLEKDATQDAMEWVETFGYHCPEVEVRS